MTNIEITFDQETGYYDGIILSKWVATQAKSLDELIANLWEAISLSSDKNFLLKKFNISYEDSHVNF